MDGGTRLVLNGQPLVIAGGVFLRQAALTLNENTGFVDFPTITGSDSNQFTIEDNAPQGIPLTSPLPSTPSQQPMYATQSTVDPPTAYVQDNVIPLNPAALTEDALW